MSDLAASVVIPALNSAATIGDQLDALAAQDVSERLEVIVVDNGSDDGTRDVVEAWGARLPHLRVADASARRGPSCARNRGLQLAECDKVLFCDDDDQVAPGWASALLAALDTADAVAGRVLPWELRSGPVPAPSGREDSFELRYDFLPAFGTNNAGVRRTAVAAVGGFDQQLRTAEDIDLAWRMQLAGQRFAVAPDAVVFGRPRRTPAALFHQTAAYGRGQVALYAKFRGDGMPRRPVTDGARGMVSLVTTTPDLVRDADARLHWFGRAGWRWGRIAGSARARVLYL
jgi:glycosyltransferase involved in cell wall biosynthesis